MFVPIFLYCSFIFLLEMFPPQAMHQRSTSSNGPHNFTLYSFELQVKKWYLSRLLVRAIKQKAQPLMTELISSPSKSVQLRRLSIF